MNDKGYIILDILLGIVIFSLGFAAAWKINISALMIGGQTDNLFQAINLAESAIEELHSNFQEDSGLADLYALREIREQKGRFIRTIRADWETTDLLLIQIEIEWVEREGSKKYCLESYCNVYNC